MKYIHPFHLVNNSPWPLTISISLYNLVISVIMGFNNIIGSKIYFYLSLLAILYSLYSWLYEIIIESTYKGEHTIITQKVITNGFMLFIVSEVVIFISLFICLFYIYFIPSVECNNLFLSTGIYKINYEALPLLNTVLLFFSSITITASQHSLISKNLLKTKYLILLTILLNSVFTLFQLFEYYYCSFTLTDSFYGSIFYFLTGLHGAHVLFGTILVYFTYLRLKHLTNSHHLLLNFSSAYTHMLDIIWILLFLLLYISLS